MILHTAFYLDTEYARVQRWFLAFGRYAEREDRSFRNTLLLPGVRQFLV